MSISPGALRFNTDSQKLELYDGNQWTEIVASSPDSQTGGARGVFGNVSPGYSNVLEYITISTTGNSADFGDLIRISGNQAAMCASSTRGLHGGGIIAPAAAFTNSIEYITISSTGNAADFGDLSGAKRYLSALSNSTRGIFAGAAGGVENVIEYVTIASTGDARDFGDLTSAKGITATFGSSTRGIISGGEGPVSALNVIDFITISTTGNAADFGDLTLVRQGSAGCSNSTRGIIAGGYSYPSTPSVTYNVIDYISITVLGNAIDFGDLTVARSSNVGGCSSPTRGIFAGGGTFPGASNVIDYITIMSIGNAIDFGDLSATSDPAACSNGHGGL